MTFRKYIGEFHSLSLVKDIQYLLPIDGPSNHDDLPIDMQPHGDDNHIKVTICK